MRTIDAAIWRLVFVKATIDVAIWSLESAKRYAPNSAKQRIVLLPFRLANIIEKLIGYER